MDMRDMQILIGSCIGGLRMNTSTAETGVTIRFSLDITKSIIGIGTREIMSRETCK